jgi:hypothetical protein
MLILLVVLVPVFLALFIIWMEGLESLILNRQLAKTHSPDE